jgi:hypothetical protein
METYIVQVLIGQTRTVTESNIERAIDAAIRTLPHQVRSAVVFERVLDGEGHIIHDWRTDIDMTPERLESELGLKVGSQIEVHNGEMEEEYLQRKAQAFKALSIETEKREWEGDL